MKDDLERLKQRILVLEEEVAALKSRGFAHKGIRKRSRRFWWGLSLYDIAMGPDLARGEMRGHARGIIAIGGGALGYYAMGGGALGEYVISGMAQDPEAVRFFNDWLPGLRELLTNR
jgi:hypothetical protein